MTRRYSTLLTIFLCLPAVQVFAQTTIGGGSCSSSTLNGTYEFLLNGRQVTTAGLTTKQFQAVGTAAFDGLSKVTLTMTANQVATTQAFGTPLTYTGTYSLQSNCIGTINITGGDTASFTLEAYQGGNAFSVIGADSTFAFNGNGNLQPAACPTTLTGVHEFNANGSSISGVSFTGVLDVAGIMQFDGTGNVTANWTQVSGLVSSTVAATGTYTLGSNCIGSATLTDAAKNQYAVSLSIFSAGPDFAVAVTSPQLLFDGGGAAAQATTGSGCSAATMSGTYEVVLSGRLGTAGVITKLLSASGTAVFDGQSKVSMTLTSSAVNGSQVFGSPLALSGTYSMQSNCQGAINITTGDTATFAIVADSVITTTGQARNFQLVGADANYAYSGAGNLQPNGCAVSSLSGTWPFSATGNSLSGSSITGVVDIAGAMQFDGQGNVTANWAQASNAGTATPSATGTYTVGADCLGFLTLTDNANNKYTGAVVIFGAAGNNFVMVTTNPQLLFTATGRAAFVNPGLAVVNAASFNSNQTPAGSDFTIFGTNLATKESQASSLPFPTTLLTTTVTINGEPAPLIYVNPTQINAQMPQDIAAGVATVIVKNGSSTSNAVAVFVPGVGTPGIIVYGNNRAVVVNQDGVTVNTPTTPAKVGDTVVAYFTGGGPVNASGPLKTGVAAPAGLSPVTGTNGVKVAGVDAKVNYMGLTPGSVGLYQANFVVPKVAAGDRAVVITISGQASNGPVMAVGN